MLLKTAGKQLTKWEVILADGTAACRCVLWEQHINEVEEGNCYNIANATVRSFNGSVIKAVEDIGGVVDDQLGFAETGGIIVIKAEIIAVLSIENYISCKSCSGKVSPTNRG